MEYSNIVKSKNLAERCYQVGMAFIKKKMKHSLYRYEHYVKQLSLGI